MGAALEPDLRTTLAAAPLVRDVVTVRGAEAIPFLQGQLSQDLGALGVGASAPALLLQPTGKAVAWLRVTRSGDDEVLLDVDAGGGDAVVGRLKRFLLRTKATLEVAPWTGAAVRGPGAGAVGTPPAAGTLRAPAGWPGVEGVDLLGPAGLPGGGIEGVLDASAAALEALRIECGVPAFGAEVTEATIPAELGQWLIEASVSFTKGCYTGQELVARVDSRGGNVPRPLRGLRVEGDAAPAPGTPVLAGGAGVGTVTSAAISPALGAVALAALPRSLEPGSLVELAAEGGPVPATVAELPLR